jgi:hypothetical protein
MTTDNRLVVTRRCSRSRSRCARSARSRSRSACHRDRSHLAQPADRRLYVLSLGVSGAFFIAAQRLANSKWWSPIRRIPEAFMFLLPAGAVLLAVLAFGFRSLYPWTDPSSPLMVDEHPLIRAGRFTYLAPSFTYVRMAGIIALWIFFAWRMRKILLEGDADRATGISAYVRLYRYSGAFVPLFALTFAAASYDWLISLEPKWFSTMFSVYVFAGTFVQGIAATALVTVTLKRKQLVGRRWIDTHVSDPGHHDTRVLDVPGLHLGLPVPADLVRQHSRGGDWYLQRSGGLAAAPARSFAVSWIIPFFTLLPLKSKRSLKVMTAFVVLVFGRWLDLYIIVMPAHWSSPRFGPIEIGMAAGAVGLIYLVVVRGLSRAPLIPTHEPVIEARRRHAHHA